VRRLVRQLACLLHWIGAGTTAAASVDQILIASVVFRFAGDIKRVETIVSKIAMLLLAAVAIMMVRKQIEVFIAASAAA